MNTATKTCVIFDCERPVKANRVCSMHHRRLWKTNTTDLLKSRGGQKKPYRTCGIEGCDKQFLAREMCRMHYRRWYLYKDPNFKLITGEKSPALYKSISMPDHPNSNVDGNILEHRYVMSQMLGRPLEAGENVHHKNGNRKDNRPENLELWNTSQPAGQRPEDKVTYAIEILSLYAPELLSLQGEKENMKLSKNVGVN